MNNPLHTQNEIESDWNEKAKKRFKELTILKATCSTSEEQDFEFQELYDARETLNSLCLYPTDTDRLDWLMSHEDGDLVLEMVNRDMIDEAMQRDY
jgi:hypothetical protein